MTVQDQAKQLKKDIKQFVKDGGYVWAHKRKSPNYAGGGEYYVLAFETKIGRRDKQEEFKTLQSIILPEGWKVYWTGTRVEMYKRIGEGELQMNDIIFNYTHNLDMQLIQNTMTV